MMIRSLLLPTLAVVALPFAAACGSARESDANTGTSEQATVSDIAKMTARGDGRFDVECRDGRTEIVSADEVTQGRVCNAAVVPSSPFGPGACSGTPMTEAVANARLGASTTPVRIGSFSVALRHRTVDYAWADAPTDALVAHRETSYVPLNGDGATFSGHGSVELARDASGRPFLRLVSDAAIVYGPDTTKRMRFVSAPMRPWAGPGYPEGPSFTLERAQGDGEFSALTDYGWTVEMRSRQAGGGLQSWWFIGDGVTAVVTDRCGQFVSSQATSRISWISSAIGIYLLLD